MLQLGSPFENAAVQRITQEGFPYDDERGSPVSSLLQPARLSDRHEVLAYPMKAKNGTGMQNVREQIKRMAIGGGGAAEQDFYAVSSSESSSSSSEGSSDTARPNYAG